MEARYAFVTLITSDAYLPGALALVAALKDVHPFPPLPPEVPFQTVCLVTPETVDVKSIKLLRRAFDVVVGVEVIEGETEDGLRLLGRADLATVLTKLHVFRLTQYSKLIFLDADVLPLRPLSHLFTLPHEFSAVPDVGWPDIFNSGVMVLSPGEDKFNEIMAIVKSKGSWDGGDQGVLNEWRGGDWHRLSFTYNTTPTAAYTYAPAYERFGSQISAIHFIGPNKPWNSIPYRAPGSSSSDSKAFTSAEQTSIEAVQIAPPPRSYAYSTLVDKWYDVYDRHYRRQSPAEEAEYKVHKYDSVWDEPTSLETGPLGLEDLRRIALEGVNVPGVTSGSVIAREGEGAYSSLPLEGRVDLMRPKRERPPPRDDSFDDQTARPSGHGSTLDGGSLAVQRLFTPGPNDVSTSPHHRPVSIPRSDPTTPIADTYQQQHYSSEPPLQHMAQHGHHHEPQHDDSQQHHHHHHHEQHHHIHQPRPQHPEHQGHQEHRGHHEHYGHQEHHGHQGHHGHQEHHGHHEHQGHHEHHEERPWSPPMLTWNAAVEPPPNVAPPPNVFPSDQYFPNVWDEPQSHWRPHHGSDGHHQQDSSSFFQPPPTHIPERLLREGHYANVTGPQKHDEKEHWQQPTPDLTKVTHVFPWEEKPRHAPGRIFPDNDAPPPGTTYIEQQISSPPKPASPEPPKVEVPTSPSRGFPQSMSFVNAWDVVPSITRYASRLVRPPPPPGPQPWPLPSEGFRRGRRDSYQSWEDRAEASSRDGDVEDEGDDESEDEVEGVSGRGGREEGEHGGHSRSTSDAKAPGGAKSGRYRSQGVQTPATETRSIGVQVSLCQVREMEKPRSSVRPSERTLATAGRAIHPTLPLAAMQHLHLEPEQMAASSPSVLPFPRTTGEASIETEHVASGALSPRLHDTWTFNSPTPKDTASRSLSNETAVSSVGPVSPVDDIGGSAAASSRKKAGRVWDPARGIDVFKRGSEQVLARFLRMGSWEDDPNAS